MVLVPASEILVGCLLLLIFSLGSSSAKPLSRESCTSQDCMLNITCTVINKYVDCTWTRLKMQETSYNFSSALRNEDSYQECPWYRRQHGQNVGCRIPLLNGDEFYSFYAKLSVGRNQTVSIKKYDILTSIVKLNPPHNLSVVWNAESGLCVRWVPSFEKQDCLYHSVRYQSGFDQWQVHRAKESPYCIPFVSKGNFTFQVRNKIGIYCGESDIWSDWSDAARWGNYTEDNPALSFQSWWQLWVPVLGVIVLIGLAVLLFYCERIKVLLVVPDPSKNVQDLFQKHHGNVESWVYISRELKDAFEPDYTESPCVVCEPSPTLKAKGCDEPEQQDRF